MITARVQKKTAYEIIGEFSVLLIKMSYNQQVKNGSNGIRTHDLRSVSASSKPS